MIAIPYDLSMVTGAAPVTTNGATTADYLNMGNALRAIVVVTLKQAVGHETPITIRQAINNAGDGVKDLAKDVPIWANEDVAASDLLVQQADGVAYTVSDTVKNKKVFFQVDGEDLDVDGGFTHITVLVGASAAATNFVNIDYIVEPRFPEQTSID